MSIRIGQGFDAHQLVAGIPLVIGGVLIPHTRGPAGHSDGDVLYHALVDALLGGLSLGDIGEHFPSSNENWRGADSKIFLETTLIMVQERHFEIINIDTTVILQEPILRPYIHKMRNNIANILQISELDRVSVKATTTDRLGFTGRMEGIAATAAVLLQRVQ